ncbi:hypothetical protein [Streptomyces sp. NBC_00258]|uniref:hypothetical protein n=1 Tax=Streptomyces sp. NBC_00258 TaxID=2903642 RepID=UPI002E2BAD17|nr:hypothetical protein [Streptomyces sp. NBC_00258]
MTAHTLPHDPYITAVVDALAAAGLEPTDAWTSEAEIDRYRTDADAGVATMLSAVLIWGGDAPGLNTEAHEDGITLVWEHPAEQWQWAPRKAHGELEHEPEFLPTLGRYADPTSVAVAVRALLWGDTPPEVYAPNWSGADAVRTAVTAWASSE